MDRRVLVAVVVAGVGLCLCVMVGAVALFFVALPGTPSSTAVSIVGVTAVPLNEPFELTLRIENLSGDEQTLDSIDIKDSYLDGIIVRSSSPAFTDQFPVPVVNYQSFTFQQTIPAGQTVDVTFLLEGAREGRYIGEIDICIDDAANCLTQTLDTTIGEAGGR